jgi:signal transduction histidine kinase/ActR/RegA family two-component response regulator
MRPFQDLKYIRYVVVVPIAIILLANFSNHVIAIPNQPAVLLLAVAYSAYRSGLTVGLVGAAIHVLYTAIFFSEADHLFTYDSANMVRTIAICVVAPTMATMIGLLRRSSDDLLARLKDSETALRQLNNDLERRVEERTTALTVEAAKRSEAEARLFEGQKLQAIGQLAGGVAHDLNNMLSVIISSLEMLLDALPTGSEQSQTLVERSIEAAERGADLTRALLAFARKQTLNPQTIDANELVRDIVSLLRRTLGEPIEVDLQLHRDLWPCTVDRTQLENAILNLAINARDAMPNGGRLTISTANTELAEHATGEGDAALNGPYVTIEIADSGVGMPPEVASRAFEPFFTTKDIGKGTGLGLSMVYGFARQSGGTARITSEPGRGAVVRLYLPRAVASLAIEQPVARTPPSRRGAGEAILVVEDNPTLALVTMEVLTALGYRPVTAPDGRSALAELERTQNVALLLTDVVLPKGMSGFELASIARRRWPDLPVIFVSGFVNETPTPDSILTRAALLSKPLRASQLADAIANVLQKAMAQ